MQERLKIEASKKEIADLDISPDRKLVSYFFIYLSDEKIFCILTY